LQKHNKKFKVAIYEPRKYSFKEVQAWEKMTGKKWYSLDANGREEANEEIKEMKRNSSIHS